MQTAVTPASDRLQQQLGGLTLNGNYTLSHCLDEVSNGGLLSFSAQGIISPLPGELSRQYGNCDYDVRHNISATVLPDSLPPLARLRGLFGGWSFFGDGIPPLRAPIHRIKPALYGQRQGVFQANGTALSSSMRPLMRTGFLARLCIRRVPLRALPWRAPNNGSTRKPLSRLLIRRREHAEAAIRLELPIWQCRTELLTRSPLHKFGRLHHKDRSNERWITFRLDAQMFNAFNHPNFALPGEVEAGYPAYRFRPDSELSKARFHHLRGCWVLDWGRQLPAHDRVSGKD